MLLRDLVEAIVGGDLLAARQWVADAKREQLRWGTLPCPRDLTGRKMAVAAGMV